MNQSIGTGRRHPRRTDPTTLRLHVQLDAAFPPVWRRIEAASDLGSDDLHDVLQVVFGWEDYHLYRSTTGPERRGGRRYLDAFTVGVPGDGVRPGVKAVIGELATPPPW